MEELLGIIGILIVIIEIYRMLRRLWIRRMLAKRKNGKRTHKAQVLRPKSEKDFSFVWQEFRGRRNTVPYRLKTHSRVVEKILRLMELGVDALAVKKVKPIFS